VNGTRLGIICLEQRNLLAARGIINEDALFALSSVLREGNSECPFGLFIVADGMGGINMVRWPAVSYKSIKHLLAGQIDRSHAFWKCRIA
jgi:serine/threonine protein phosphatase PrpC